MQWDEGITFSTRAKKKLSSTFLKNIFIGATFHEMQVDYYLQITSPD